MVSTSSKTKSWYRRKWLVVSASVVLLLLIAGGSAAVLLRNHPRHVVSTAPTAPTISKSTALQRWWSETSKDFAATRDASDDVQHAIDRLDPIGLETSCQRLHDAADVKLKAHLPSPEPELTAEISAAIEDYHMAAHMCLSAAAGSVNSYVGEFQSYKDEANRHMKAAQDIINRMLVEI